MRTKKGVELGVNTMIIVVVALLVLVIVGYLVIKSAATTNKETSCRGRGYECVANIAACTDGIPGSLSCKGDPGGDVCCIRT